MFTHKINPVISYCCHFVTIKSTLYFGCYRYNKCHFCVIFGNYSCAISFDSKMENVAYIKMEPVIIMPTLQEKFNSKMKGLQTEAKTCSSELMKEKTAVDHIEAAIRSLRNDLSILIYIIEMELNNTVADDTKNSIEDITKRLNNTTGPTTLSETKDFSSNRMTWAYQSKSEFCFEINQKPRLSLSLKSICASK